MRRVALVGETVDQVVSDVMIFGESGIMACSPPDRRNRSGIASRQGADLWPNGAVAQVFSAHEPEALRGPQFDAAWVDELGKWKKGSRPGISCSLRCGWGTNPRQVVTTTPRNVGVLEGDPEEPVDGDHPCPDRGEPGLSGGKFFLAEVQARYGGTSVGAAGAGGRAGGGSVEGRAVDARRCWKRARASDACPQFSRIVVAVDPPVTGRPGQATNAGSWWWGRIPEGRAEGLAGRGAGGCQRQGGLARRLGAGGAGGDGPAWGGPAGGRGQPGGRSGGTGGPDRSTPWCRSAAVHATRSKMLRAEPVAALYEQGRVAPCAGVWGAGRADVPDDGAGLAGHGLARPAGCAGLGADRSDGGTPLHGYGVTQRTVALADFAGNCPTPSPYRGGASLMGRAHQAARNRHRPLAAERALPGAA